MRNFFTLFFLLFGFISSIKAQSFSCNNPLVGYNYVVDNVDDGILSLLSNENSFNHVIDQDLTNYVQVNMTAVLLNGKVTSVKKINGSFTSGKKAGFVIEVPGSLVTLDLLGGLSIRTYLNNVAQETVSLGGGSGLLKLSLLNSGIEGRRRIEFTTTKAFDEIELVKTGVVSALTNLRIYNAYVSDASCNNDCSATLTTNNYSSASASTNNFLNSTRLTDTNQANYATQASALNLGLIGLSGYIQANAGVDISAGADVGFYIQQPGLLGLISLDLLQGMTISTYNSVGGLVEQFNAGSLLDASLLSDGFANIGFKSTQSFRSVRLTIGGLGLTPIRVYYGYVRLDTDNDSVPDCLDNCNGNDLLVNAKGQPVACYPDCNLNAGADISGCPANSDGAVQLKAAGIGNTWVALSGNPSAATIDSSGSVEGMSTEGIYRFRLYNAICSDTVSVNYKTGNLGPECNRALLAPNAVIDNKTPFGGICLMCDSSGAANVVDNNPDNYLEYSQLLSLANPTSLIAVRDTNNIYPAGTRVGYVVSFPDGLLSASLFNVLQLRTYLDGDFVEVATGVNGLLGAGVLAGVGNKSRISFVTTQPFDKVELIVGDLIGLLTTIRVHNAFAEPESCPSGTAVSLNPQTACYEILTADSIGVAKINYNKTGFGGVACALCKIDSLSNILDNSYSNYATLNVPLNALGYGGISVQTKKIFTSGYEAGFAVSGDASLLELNVLENIAIVTYLNGVMQDSIKGNSGLISATLLPGSNSIGFLGFRSPKSFNEVRLVLYGTVNANILTSGLKVYYAYARLDTDGDGIPDCLDKCCNGNEDDDDGDGVPNGCDINIKAVGDNINGLENSSTQINVLDNDTLGIHSLSSFTIAQQPAHGTAVIDDNGTPNDFTDDFIVYTPDSSFIGKDTLIYEICDSYNICSQASVIVDVLESFKVLDDNIAINEDTAIAIDVLGNDAFGPDGLNTTPLTIVSLPANGIATVNDNGTPNDPTDDWIDYTPTLNFYGLDSLDYEICDANDICLIGTVYFTINPVNDAPVANNDTVTVNNNNVLSIDVLANDNDFADGVDGGLDSSQMTIVTQPVNGTVTIDPVTYELVYTPSPDFHGADSLVYEVCDIGFPLPALCSQATVYINVLHVFTAMDDSTYLDEDTYVVVDVLANDVFGPNGPGNSPIQIVTPPQNGTASVNMYGTLNDPTDDRIEYTPYTDYNGLDSLVYEICDGSNNCKTATIYFIIEAVNDAPEINADAFHVVPNTTVTINVIANDNDNKDFPYGGIDISTLSIVTYPQYGALSVNYLTGELIYTPNTNFIGSDSLLYEVCDSGYPLPSLCGQAMVYLDVRDILVVVSDNISLDEDTPTVIDVLANDEWGSVGAGSLPISIIANPLHGTAIVNDNGTPNDPTDDWIDYTPALNFYGTDSFTYQICDALDSCSGASVYLTVLAVNDPPVAQDDYALLPSGGYISVPVLGNDNDNADAPLGGLDLATLTVLSQPYNGSAVVNTYNGHIIYTADPGFYGTDTVIYRICDVGYPAPSACDTAQLVVKVGEPDLSPNILILPSILEGPSTFYILIEAHEINNAPTDGSEILLIMPRDPYIHFTYNPALTNILFFNLNNSSWTYDNSNPDFHIFKTNEVIPPSGVLTFGLEAFFDPQGSSGQKPITISVYQGGGESNFSNNTDVEMLIFFRN